MISTKLVLRKEKVNTSNLAPISIRIIYQRQTSYISSGISVAPHEWDNNRSIIKKTHRQSARLNAILNKILLEVEELALKQIHDKSDVTANSIKNAYLGKNENDFFAISYQLVDRSESIGSVGTHDKNLSVIRKIKEYIGSDTLPFKNMTPTFIREYEQYLIRNKGNKRNTVASNLKFMRRVFNEAYQQGIIQYDANPFLKLKISSEPTSRSFLTEEELARIESLQYKEGSRISLARDAFVWGCYSGGIRVSDMLLLSWQNFDGVRISFTARKTKGQHSLKLPQKSIAILHRVKAVFNCYYIFPFIKEALNESNVRMLDLATSRATASYNKLLRKIAVDAGISKGISSHTARHTFATRALRHGTPLEYVQQFLQHKSPNVTQIYAKLSSADLDSAMDKFNQ